MRASPACQVTLQHFGVWRAAVLGVSLAGAASASAWLAGRGSALSTPLVAAAAVASLSMAALVWSLLRTPVRHLRWDGQIWHLDTVPGDLAVVIDLGPWMLLRFASAAPARVVWLPVQRRGIAAQWHVLRCAVYSPRPPAGP